MTSQDIGDIIFGTPGAPTPSGLSKVKIHHPNGKRVFIETGKCFTFGLKKDDRCGFTQYTMHVSLKNDQVPRL